MDTKNYEYLLLKHGKTLSTSRSDFDRYYRLIPFCEVPEGCHFLKLDHEDEWEHMRITTQVVTDNNAVRLADGFAERIGLSDKVVLFIDIPNNLQGGE